MDDGVDYMHPDLRDNYVSTVKMLKPNRDDQSLLVPERTSQL